MEPVKVKCDICRQETATPVRCSYTLYRKRRKPKDKDRPRESRSCVLCESCYLKAQGPRGRCSACQKSVTAKLESAAVEK